MRCKVLLAAALLACATGVFAWAGASAKETGPSAGNVLVAGLLQPKGITVGPDGMLYIAESGTGGFAPDGTDMHDRYTGRISKVDPDTGERTTVVDGLASSGVESLGPTDVAFIGDNLYYLQTVAGDAEGFPDFTGGIYRIDDDGDLTLVADLGAFTKDNPVEAVASGEQGDVDAGGNPYAMKVHNGAFYVTDGNQNRLLRVTTGGTITEIVEFPHHPVSTGLDFDAHGTAFVGYLGRGPFLPEDGKVVSVDLGSEAITDVASGQPWITDVEFGPAEQLYALQFNNKPAMAEGDIAPFQGTLLTVNDDGTMSPLVTGLSFPTSVVFDGETAYVVNGSVTSNGEIVKIEDFSAVRAPLPEPTAAPTQAPAPTATAPAGQIGAPDTGSGRETGGVLLALTMLVGAGGIVLAIAGVRASTRHLR